MAFNIQGPPSSEYGMEGVGVPDLGKALMNGFKLYQGFHEAKNTPAKLAEDLLKQKLLNAHQGLENKWYEPSMQSTIGLQSAHTKQALADIGLNDIRRQLMQAQASQAGAAAQKSQMIQQMMQQILSGNQGGMNASAPSQQVQPPGNQMPEYGQNISNGMPTMDMGNQTQQSQGMPQQSQQMPMQQNQQPSQFGNINYPQASLMSKMLGLGEPKIIDVDGQKLAVTPFGNIPVASGMTPLQKELTKTDAKQIQGLEQTAVNGMTNQTTLDSLGEIVAQPVFEQMRQHPIAGKFELSAYSKFGTPEQQQLSNQYMTLTGQIIKDAARDFHGQFRVGEQALLNSMKPSLSDTAEGAKAKIEALSYMNQMLTKRSQIAAQVMRDKGVSSVKAYEEADRMVNGKAVREAINKSLHPAKQKINKRLRYNLQTGDFE